MLYPRALSITLLVDVLSSLNLFDGTDQLFLKCRMCMHAADVTIRTE